MPVPSQSPQPAQPDLRRYSSDQPVCRLASYLTYNNRDHSAVDFKPSECTNARAFCDWPFADAVSLDRNSDLQCFTKPGALDCDCAVRRSEALGSLWLFWVAPVFGGVVGGIIGRWLHQE